MEELQYFVRILKATACSRIRQRASATAFHVGSLAFRSHRLNISCLQRSLPSPWKFLSILLSSWSSKPNFTPSECQSTTESSAFESSFRVGVAGAVGKKNEQSTVHGIHIRRCTFLRQSWYQTHVSPRIVQDLVLPPSLLFVVLTDTPYSAEVRFKGMHQRRLEASN